MSSLEPPIKSNIKENLKGFLKICSSFSLCSIKVKIHICIFLDTPKHALIFLLIALIKIIILLFIWFRFCEILKQKILKCGSMSGSKIIKNASRMMHNDSDD
uniref:Uncharacterized protein n=1 Tax=Glossina austeni TaxID=7395 RepID=A0A1A9VM79_GLOAU